MKAYRVIDGEFEAKPSYWPTRKDAHDQAKEQPLRADVRVEHVEFDTNQSAVCDMLSGRDFAITVLSTWRLSSRGGLVECPNGE